MEKPFELLDSEFEKLFRNTALNPSLFNHEAHLRLAWIHIQKYGVEQAKINIHNQIKSFVVHVGAEDKYNITLTIAAIEAVNHFIGKSRSNTFKEFIAEFPQLKNNFKGLIESHYSFDIFNSEKAKKEFLAPDLSGF